MRRNSMVRVPRGSLDASLTASSLNGTRCQRLRESQQRKEALRLASPILRLGGAIRAGQSEATEGN